MNPIRSALRNRSVVLVLTGFAVLLGVGALFTMPRREDPKITIRTGLVLALLAPVLMLWSALFAAGWPLC